MSGKGIKGSLKRTLGIAFSIMVLLAGVIAGSTYYFFESTSTEKSFSENMELKSNEFSKILAIHLWNMDNQAIELVGETLLHSREIVGVRVSDENENVIFEGGQFSGKYLKDIHREVGYDGISVGRLEITFSMAQLLRARQHIVFTVVLVVLAIIISFFIYSQTILGHFVTGPIKKLIASAEIVGMGNLEQIIAVESTDEIGQLSMAFGEMTANLRTTTASRDELNREIEERKKVENSLRNANAALDARTCELKEEVEVRRLTEEELVRQRVFLEAVLENISDGVVACDETGTLSYFNPASREFHGIKEEALPPEEWAGRYDLYLADATTPMTRDDIPLYKAFMGNEVRDVEMVISPTHGRRRTFLASGRAMFDSEGRKLGAVVSMHDITERKEAEEEIIKANERLKELDKLKSMFIASMSHELRTPLNSIIGFTGVILQGLSGELNDIQSDQLRRVHASANHLLELISDIIDISKIEAGKIEVSPESFDVDVLLNEAIGTVKLQAEEKGVDIVMDVPQGITLHTDRRRLMQCILNYLSNAVKFTPGGRIRVTAREDGGDVEVMVEDTGIGIPAEDLQRLFMPFERIEVRVRKAIPGTGLGLYLTRKIATELLGGSVNAESEPGAGARFYIRIPRELEGLVMQS